MSESSSDNQKKSMRARKLIGFVDGPVSSGSGSHTFIRPLLEYVEKVLGHETRDAWRFPQGISRVPGVEESLYSEAYFLHYLSVMMLSYELVTIRSSLAKDGDMSRYSIVISAKLSLESEKAVASRRATAVCAIWGRASSFAWHFRRQNPTATYAEQISTAGILAAIDSLAAVSCMPTSELARRMVPADVRHHREVIAFALRQVDLSPIESAVLDCVETLRSDPAMIRKIFFGRADDKMG